MGDKLVSHRSKQSTRAVRYPVDDSDPPTTIPANAVLPTSAAPTVVEMPAAKVVPLTVDPPQRLLPFPGSVSHSVEENRPRAVYFPDDTPENRTNTCTIPTAASLPVASPGFASTPAPYSSGSMVSSSLRSLTRGGRRPKAIYKPVDDDSSRISVASVSEQLPVSAGPLLPSNLTKRRQLPCNTLESNPQVPTSGRDSGPLIQSTEHRPSKRRQAAPDHPRPTGCVKTQQASIVSHGPAPMRNPPVTATEEDSDVDTGGLQATVPIPRIFFGDIVGRDRIPCGFAAARYPKFAPIESTHHVSITGPQALHHDGFLTITGSSAAGVAAARSDLMREIATAIGIPHLDLALHSSEYVPAPKLEDVQVFVDYSNIACGWPRDKTLDIATLDGWMLGDRPAAHKEVAGTMPPDLVCLWSALGYEVTATRGDKIGNVDEFLHAQVYHAVFGGRTAGPGTLILATGDGNSNSGKSTFPSCVVAALRLGWCVEIVSWKASLSWVYEFLETLCPSRVRVRLIDDAFPSTPQRMQAYLRQCATAVFARDGVAFGGCISTKIGQNYASMAAMCAGLSIDAVVLSAGLPDGFDEIVAAHLKTVLAVHGRDAVAAYTEQLNCLSKVLEAFERDGNSWMHATLRIVIVDSRAIVDFAERETARLGKPLHGDAVEKLATIFRKAFAVCFQDRTDFSQSRRQALLMVVNHTCKAYFKRNSLRMCKPLIDRALTGLTLQHFPKSDQVTFLYIRGRLALFNGDYKTADDDLSQALALCPVRAKANRRRIVESLVPARLHRGILPTDSLLAKYGLVQYAGIVSALRSGNVKQFRDEMELHRVKLLRSDVFLILEQMEPVVLKRLFKRVTLICPSEKSQYPLQLFVDALAAIGVDMDIDEVQCMLANMIVNGQLKGYIAHAHRVLVTAKSGAFPKP